MYLNACISLLLSLTLSLSHSLALSRSPSLPLSLPLSRALSLSLSLSLSLYTGAAGARESRAKRACGSREGSYAGTVCKPNLNLRKPNLSEKRFLFCFLCFKQESAGHDEAGVDRDQDEAGPRMVLLPPGTSGLRVRV
jgi:hypothetical protein